MTTVELGSDGASEEGSRLRIRSLDLCLSRERGHVCTHHGHVTLTD